MESGIDLSPLLARYFYTALASKTDIANVAGVVTAITVSLPNSLFWLVFSSFS